MKPIDEWDEEYIANLPSGENDHFDRKHSQTLIDATSGQGADKKRLDLSCDVSSFANSGGGFVIYGVNNAGIIDGGVPTRLKTNGTYDWLDALVGDLVEPILRGYHIREIKGDIPGTLIKPDHAIYVLSIPDSEDAPHQARDLRYYLRVNAHNYAARHRQIEDMRSRRRNPLIEGYIEFTIGETNHNQHEGHVLVLLWPVCHLTNIGRVTAHDVSLTFTYPEFSRVSYTPRRNLVRCDTDSERRRLMIYMDAPLHPGQSLAVYLGDANLAFEYSTFREMNTKCKISEISFPSTLYVENAPPISIDASFASDRVSTHLRREMASKFDWIDPDEGTYKK